MGTDRDSYCTPSMVTRCLPVVDMDPCSNPLSRVRAKRHIMLPKWRKRCEARLLAGERLPEGEIVYGDGVAEPWDDLIIFDNPPFSDPLPFAEKAMDAAEYAFLVHIDPTAKWWKYLRVRGRYVYPFDRRVPYLVPAGVDESSDRVPSCLIVTPGFRDLMAREPFQLDCGEWLQSV